ncbi:hypothetical protein TNCV_1300001 [Trichonephila clavipes]|nr:hypothetical protein TNCV_1300001 [Trichonephila clavipes]
MTFQYPEIRLVSRLRALCAKRPVRNHWLNRSRRLRNNISLIESKERFLHKKLVEGQMNRKKCRRPSGTTRREQIIEDVLLPSIRPPSPSRLSKRHFVDFIPPTERNTTVYYLLLRERQQREKGKKRNEIQMAMLGHVKYRVFESVSYPIKFR